MTAISSSWRNIAKPIKLSITCFEFLIKLVICFCWNIVVDEVYRLAFAAEAAQQRGRFEIIGGNAGQRLRKTDEAR